MTSSLRLVGSIVTVTLVLGGNWRVAAQASRPGTLELFRQSDFVGLVVANPVTVVGAALVTPVDPIKGAFGRDAGIEDTYPRALNGVTSAFGYPSCFSRRGEYLVFLRKPQAEGATAPNPIPADPGAVTGLTRRLGWIPLATIRVAYRRGPTGTLVGSLVGDATQPIMTVAQARTILERVAAGAGNVADVRALDERLQSAAAAMDGPASPCARPTADVRLREAREQAAMIAPGTTRADVERLLGFPSLDGGLSGPNDARYYLDPEVKVQVTYDGTGGRGSSQNRVVGLVQVYRQGMNLD